MLFVCFFFSVNVSIQPYALKRGTKDTQGTAKVINRNKTENAMFHTIAYYTVLYKSYDMYQVANIKTVFIRLTDFKSMMKLVGLRLLSFQIV